MKNQTAYIIGGMRTPFVKSLTKYRDVTAQTLMTSCLDALVSKFSLANQIMGDVAMGGTIRNSLEWDFARECVLGTALNPHTSAYSVQRACGSGLDASIQIALKIAAGEIETGIASGVDTNSDIQFMLPKSFSQKMLAFHVAKNFREKISALLSLRPSDFKLKTPSVREPRTGLSMGEHCEKMVKEWNISQRAQDELALRSHELGTKAWEEGFYDDLVFDFHGVKKDGTLRSNTSLEQLAKLKPAFDFSEKGTLTAGNSSPLTDGSASVLFASEKAVQQYNWTPWARFVDAQTAAVDFVHGEGLLMAPTIAVSNLLERNQLSLQDFDFYEIHEAFAGQVLCTLKAWESAEYCKRVLHRDQPLGSIDRTKMNVKGGSVALGHPFGATGARLIASLSKMLYQKGKGRGLISICTAGGMGVAAILESV